MSMTWQKDSAVLAFWKCNQCPLACEAFEGPVEGDNLVDITGLLQ